jgi:flavodoxin I
MIKMKRIGIFYCFRAIKTSKLGEKIIDIFGNENIEAFDAETVTLEGFLKYENIIVGVPTWFDGELPIYWDEFVPTLKEMDLRGKKIAIYGLGDQKGYAENFNDGVGIFAHIVALRGAEIVGFTSTEGYNFESSKAVMDGWFCGLCLDQENQPRLTQKRVIEWIEQLKKEFY